MADTTTTHQRLLNAASNLLGLPELSLRMKIPQEQLRAWMSGERAMPDSALLTLSKVLAEWSQRPKT